MIEALLHICNSFKRVGHSVRHLIRHVWQFIPQTSQRYGATCWKFWCREQWRDSQ